MGNLGAFLRAVEDGTVPKGSWLLVESLDRLSREWPAEASYRMQGIIREGVAIVDLSDNGRVYNTAALNSPDGLMYLMAMLLSFARGNQESALKGMRVAQKYAEKRRVFATNAKLTQPYTRRLPGWIRWNASTCEYEEIEDRTALLRWMFEMADSDVGVHRITARLNETKADTWGAGGWKATRWHKSYVRKLLSNKAAIGIFVPHKVTKVAGKRTKERIPQEPITHRFPVAVDRELFERVNARLSITRARGRNAKAPVRNIFAGVMKCRYCGGTVTKVNKGDHVYLVCSAAHAKAGTCKYESVPYGEALEAFRDALGATLDTAPRGNDTTEIESKIAQIRVEIDGGENEVNQAFEVRVTDNSQRARERLQRAELGVEELRESLRKLVERRDTLTSSNVRIRLAAVEKALTREPTDTEEANKALRGAVRKMIMRPQVGRLDILWHHAEEAQETLFMTSRFDWDNNDSEKV